MIWSRPAGTNNAEVRQTGGSGWRRNTMVVVFGIFVFAFSLWDGWPGISDSYFHPDESRWINRAYYLEDALHPLSSVWEERYLTRGQPPMGSYVIGAGLLLQGRDLTTNGPWDFQYGFESNVTWNVTRDNMPSQGDIVAARRFNLILGSLTCVAIYLIVLQFTNIAGGVVAGLFMAVNPLQHYLATLSTSDTVFTTFVACSVLAAMWLARKPNWWRALLLALGLGAGAATKLSPLFLAAGLALFGLVLILDPFLLRLPGLLGRSWKVISQRDSALSRPIGITLLPQPIFVAIFFVLSYPYLWPDPIGRTRNMFDFRRFEMDSQASFWPQAAITSRSEAVRRTWENLNDRYSSTERVIHNIGHALGRNWSGYSFDLYLAVPGVVILVYLAWRSGLASPLSLAAVTIGGQSLLILLALGVDFNRYYLPLLFAAAVGVGVLVGTLVHLAQVIWQHAVSPRFRHSNASDSSNLLSGSATIQSTP